MLLAQLNALLVRVVLRTALLACTVLCLSMVLALWLVVKTSLVSRASASLALKVATAASTVLKTA